MIITRPVCKITIFSKSSIFVSIWIGIHNSPLCSLYFQENLLQSYLNWGEGAMSCSVNGGGESGLELVNKGLVGMCVTDGLCSGAGRWPSVWVFAVFNQCSAEQPVRQGPLVGNLNVDRERATTDSGLLDWHKKNNHRNSNLRSIQLFPQSALSLKQLNVDLMQDYLMTFF